MTHITNDTSKGQLQKFTFMQDAAAASQSAVAMNVVEAFEATAPAVLTVTQLAVPFDFGIVAVTVSSSAARTAGTLTADVSRNGTATGFTVKLDATNTQWAAAAQPREADVGVAADRIGVLLTTDAGWLPATADIVVDVYAIVYLEGV